VQHYGYRYDYRSRSVDPSMYLGELPEWARGLDARLLGAGVTTRASDQVIVNEYEPGQGIAAHVDCEPCFDGIVASISLGTACVMTFTEIATRRTEPVLLAPRSLIVMTGAARYEWTHAIGKSMTDRVEGKLVRRGRRVSLTFRKVLLA
jgi:alkylated DNA repair dioxygenase AlkB